MCYSLKISYSWRQKIKKSSNNSVTKRRKCLSHEGNDWSQSNEQNRSKLISRENRFYK